MAGFVITGTLHAVLPEQQIKTLRKREFVLEVAENPQYPQLIKFELINDKCDLVEPYSVGEPLEVHFNLKGREWVNPKGEKLYFTTLDAWRLLRPGTQGNSRSRAKNQDEVYNDIQGDDIPF